MKVAGKVGRDKQNAIQVRSALNFAANAHQNQKQVYVDEPYIYHLIAVAKIVAEVSEDPDMLTAALLHDVLKETRCTRKEIEQRFGSRVAEIISVVTSVSVYADDCRALRREIDLRHLGQVPVAAQTILLADMIDNCLRAQTCYPEFARSCLSRQEKLLSVLADGDATLQEQAREMISGYRSDHDVSFKRDFSCEKPGVSE